MGVFKLIKLLIVDDNKQITETLKTYANNEGMEVSVAYDGEKALELFKNNKYDIILLDVMMPKMNGYELCKTIRKTSMVPIIMITAKGEDYERIMGLDYGADDYIVKPFSLGEVMARMRAILRRIESKEANLENIIKIENLELNKETYEVKIDDKNLMLTKKEFEILWTLSLNKGRVYTRENLLDILWGYDYYGDSRTVDTHIKRLRAKFPKNQKWNLSTVRGIGYKFEVENEK